MSGEATLWHFTCEHGASALGRRGTLVPYAQPMVAGMELVWLTADGTAARWDLGLSSELLSCDRMAARYRVSDPSGCVQWSDVMAGLDAARLGEGRDVSSWWVSPVAVPVVRA